MSHHSDELSRQSEAPRADHSGRRCPAGSARAQPSPGRPRRQRPHFPARRKRVLPTPEV